MQRSIIAIDPGRSGGLAIKYPTGPAYADKMPETEGDIAETLKSFHSICSKEEWEPIAIVELVPTGWAGKGAAMSKLNANAGFIRGCLMTLGIKTLLIRPAEWQAFYNLGKRSGCKSDSDWKGKLKAEAQRRFPGLQVTLKTADAILLLEYALSTKENQ